MIIGEFAITARVIELRRRASSPIRLAHLPNIYNSGRYQIYLRDTRYLMAEFLLYSSKTQSQVGLLFKIFHLLF